MKLLHSAVLLAAAISTVTAGERFRSDYEYHHHAQGWFKFYNKPTEWRLAEMQCFNEGAVLASPIDDDVKDVMTSIMEENANAGSTVHTGIHNTYNNALYTSVEGVLLSEMPVKYQELAIDEYVSSTYCIRMNIQGELVVGNCAVSLPFICYKKKNAEVKQPVCSTIYGGYHYDTWTGHCYKFHKYATSWKNAFMTCATEGGYLAIINSDEEANVLKELFAKYPASSIRGADNNDVVNIGYLNWYRTGIWRTIHGERLQDAGYAGWGPGKPDTLFYKGEDPVCGSLSRGGKLDDNYCNLPSAFICEKAPENVNSLTVY